MTIGAFILNPQNDFERNFFIPVATESFYKEGWLPVIESLGLQWTNLFTTGVDIEKEDVSVVIDELIQIKEWVERNIKKVEQREKWIERIEILKVKLPKAFQREDVVVYIG